MIPETEIACANQRDIDSCKKRLGANPKTLKQLAAENNWQEYTRNYQKLHDALINITLGTLVLTDGAEI